MEDLSIDGGGTHKHTRKAFLDDDDEYADEMPLSTAKDISLTQVQFEQARKWILSKYVGIDDWQRKYDSYVNNTRTNNQINSSSTDTSKEFSFMVTRRVVRSERCKFYTLATSAGPPFQGAVV